MEYLHVLWLVETEDSFEVPLIVNPSPAACGKKKHDGCAEQQEQTRSINHHSNLRRIATEFHISVGYGHHHS
jgi:hypothetical protein